MIIIYCNVGDFYEFMAKWQKVSIQRENGEWVDAQAPIIISASRSTDIPAFYADWFFHRLKVGYSAWTNPFNSTRSYISYANTRFIIFWSKNPKPLLRHIDKLKKCHIDCYIQFTLNDYETEGLEKGVPPLSEHISTFKKLAEYLGKERIIWRFDPLILTDKIDIGDLLHKIEYIGHHLWGFTEKLVFSFADISIYRKVKRNLEENRIYYREWDTRLMEDFAARLSAMNRQWNYELSTCCEEINIEKYGIRHNRCIDDRLIIRLAHTDKTLMESLGVNIFDTKSPKNLLLFTEPPQEAVIIDNHRYALTQQDNKDRGQRHLCGCIASKDIGEYNTCIHHCEYCYANASTRIATQNYRLHLLNPLTETIKE